MLPAPPLTPTSAFYRVESSEILQPGGRDLVVFPPGADQSPMLAKAIVRLLRSGHPPSSLVLISGTDRAPFEVREIAAKMCPDAARVPAHARTGFLIRLLREESEKPEWSRDFTVLRYGHALTWIANLIESMKLMRKGRGRTKADAVLGLINRLRVRRATPFDVPTFDDYGVYERDRAIIDDLADRFALAKAAHNMLDANDVMFRAVELANLQAARDRLDGVRTYLMTHLEAVGAPQLHALSKIVGPNGSVFAACDDSQQFNSYVFPRGSTASEFEKRFAGRVLFPNGVPESTYAAWSSALELPAISPPVGVAPPNPFAIRTERPAVPPPEPPCVAEVVDDSTRPTLHVVADTRTLVRSVVANVLRLVDRDGVPVEEQLIVVQATGATDALRDTLADHGIGTHTAGLGRADDLLGTTWLVSHLEIVANFRHYPAWVPCRERR